MKTLKDLGFKKTEKPSSTHFDLDSDWIVLFDDGSLTIRFNSVPSVEIINAIKLELNRPKLTEEVKQLIRLLPLEVKWLACDSSGSIFGYEEKPTKYNSVWGGDVIWSLSLFNHLLSPLISWNDTEPVNLDEWRALI